MYCPVCGEECRVSEDKSGELCLYCWECDEYYD